MLAFCNAKSGGQEGARVLAFLRAQLGDERLRGERVPVEVDQHAERAVGARLGAGEQPPARPLRQRLQPPAVKLPDAAARRRRGDDAAASRRHRSGVAASSRRRRGVVDRRYGFEAIEDATVDAARPFDANPETLEARASFLRGLGVEGELLAALVLPTAREADDEAGEDEDAEVVEDRHEGAVERHVGAAPTPAQRHSGTAPVPCLAD